MQNINDNNNNRIRQINVGSLITHIFIWFWWNELNTYTIYDNAPSSILGITNEFKNSKNDYIIAITIKRETTNNWISFSNITYQNQIYTVTSFSSKFL